MCYVGDAQGMEEMAMRGMLTSVRDDYWCGEEKLRTNLWGREAKN